MKQRQRVRRALIVTLLLGAGTLIAMRISPAGNTVDEKTDDPGRNTRKLRAEVDPPGRGPSAIAKADSGWKEQLTAFQSRTDEPTGRYGDNNMIELHRFVLGIPAREIVAAVSRVEELQSGSPTVYGRELLSRLARRWAEADATAASKWALALASRDERRDTLTGIAGAWGKAAYNDAAAWAKALPPGQEREAALGAIVAEAVYSNAPLPALELAVAMDATVERDNLIARAAGVWATQDGESATAWARTVSDQTLRSMVLAEVAISRAELDPAGAATLAVTGLPPGETRQRAVIGVLQRWMLVDPAGGKEWIESFPEGSVRSAALEAVKRMEEHERTYRLSRGEKHPAR